MALNKLFKNIRHIQIYYDGDCPFCSRYTDLLQLKETIEKVELIDARQHPEAVKKMFLKGYNLDDGMVVVADEDFYVGKDAVSILSYLSERKSMRSIIYYYLFKNDQIASIVYPILRFIRNITLKMLDKKPLNTK